MLSNQLIFCHPLFLLPSIFFRISVLSNELAFHISSGAHKIKPIVPREEVKEDAEGIVWSSAVEQIPQKSVLSTRPCRNQRH